MGKQTVEERKARDKEYYKEYRLRPGIKAKRKAVQDAYRAPAREEALKAKAKAKAKADAQRYYKNQVAKAKLSAIRYLIEAYLDSRSWVDKIAEGRWV